MEELKARHHKEQKDLQGRITQKKKNATKKTRKGVNDECERLERDLREQQQAELDAFNGIYPDEIATDLKSVNPERDGLDEVSDFSTEWNGEKHVTFAASLAGSAEETMVRERQKRPNRQTARLARRAAEYEAAAATAADEAANLPDLREQEMTAMKQHMEKYHVTETYIRPDGHCLYSAFAHSMPEQSVRDAGPHGGGYQNIRFAAASFISQHPDDFSAFLEEPLDSYVQKVKDTAEWGGQLELQAIARSFQVRINVLQASGHVEKIEPNTEPDEGKEVWLAYYRHSFGLGEHYNALKKAERN